MARIRTIKPEAFVSESLAEVSLTAERTFFGLLTQVDDSGRLRDNAAIVQGAIWPLRPTHTVADVEEDLRQLEKEGLICRYRASDGKRFLHLPTFLLHQKISHPTPTKLPPCPSHDGPKDGSDPDSDANPDRSGNAPEGSREIPEASGPSTDEATPEALPAAATVADLEVQNQAASFEDFSGISPEPSGNSRLARARAQAPEVEVEVEVEVEQGKGEHPYGAVPLFAAPPPLDPEPEAAAPPERPKGKSSRSTKQDTTPGIRIPDDFALTDELREWGRLNAPHVNGPAETEEFIDYWRGVPGAKGKKADWIATWRNRMRELEKRALAQLPSASAPALHSGGGKVIAFPGPRVSATDRAMAEVRSAVAEAEAEIYGSRTS